MQDVYLEHAMYSRWDYATSTARYDPLPPPRPQPSYIPRSLPAPRPSPPATGPIQLSTGVWYENDDILHSPEWPPVQQYLNDVRKQKTLLPAPSDLILVLAALSVVRQADDIAHWIFWTQATYWTIAPLVDSIALQQPRIIKCDVPWNGSREWKHIVSSLQMKFTTVHILGRWYSTEAAGAGADTHNKRTLRSTADVPEITPNDYFGIVDNEGPSRRRPVRALVKRPAPSPNSPAKRARRPAQQPTARVSSSPDPAEDPEPPQAPAPAPANRTSSRVRRKLTPSARSPRIVSAPSGPTTLPEPTPAPVSAPALAALALAAAAPTHTRNRSSSAQSSSSADTVVARSPSIETTVGPSSPAVSPASRKRKLEEIEEAVDVVDVEDAVQRVGAPAVIEPAVVEVVDVVVKEVKAKETKKAPRARQRKRTRV